MGAEGTDESISASVAAALDRSYVRADAEAIETAAVDLVGALMQQIPALHRSFHLERSLSMDLDAAALVRSRQVA